MNIEKILERMFQRMPEPNQISDLLLLHSYNQVRFTWKGKKFKISEDLFVEEVQGNFLVRSGDASLLELQLNK